MITKERTWAILDTQRKNDQSSHWIHGVILTLIVFSIIAVAVDSVRGIHAQFDHFFDVFEIITVAVFTVEYLARVWSCTVDPRFAHPVWGRLRFMATPMAVIDLLAILPFYITVVDVDLRFIRAFRLVRLARIAKMGRYTEASGLLVRVLRAKKEELALTMSFLLILALICASLMYYAEGNVQPDKFPNIPAAMWWSIITITTIGYGDVYPITPIGKLIGVFTALLGILMIALPTGVFGAAFVEELNRKKTEPRKCPHCGEVIDN